MFNLWSITLLMFSQGYNVSMKLYYTYIFELAPASQILGGLRASTPMCVTLWELIFFKHFIGSIRQS